MTKTAPAAPVEPVEPAASAAESEPVDVVDELAGYLEAGLIEPWQYAAAVELAGEQLAAHAPDGK